MRQIPAGRFKDICLKVLDEVAAARIPVVITKWGRPVARLVPAVSRAPRAQWSVPEEQGDGAASRAREEIVPCGSEIAASESGAAGTSGAGRAPGSAGRRLRSLAGELGVTPDALLHEALDAYTNDGGLSGLIEAAKRAVGAYRSGSTTTACDHDKEIDGIWMDWRRK